MEALKKETNNTLITLQEVIRKCEAMVKLGESINEQLKPTTSKDSLDSLQQQLQPIQDLTLQLWQVLKQSSVPTQPQHHPYPQHPPSSSSLSSSGPSDFQSLPDSPPSSPSPSPPASSADFQSLPDSPPASPPHQAVSCFDGLPDDPPETQTIPDDSPEPQTVPESPQAPASYDDKEEEEEDIKPPSFDFDDDEEDPFAGLPSSPPSQGLTTLSTSSSSSSSAVPLPEPVPVIQDSGVPLTVTAFKDEWIHGKDVDDAITVSLKFPSIPVLCVFFRRLAADGGGQSDNNILASYKVQRIQAVCQETALQITIRKTWIDGFVMYINNTLDQILSSSFLLPINKLNSDGFNEEYKLFLTRKKAVNSQALSQTIALPNGKKIVALRGDLLAEKTDAVVNPSNEQLSNQGGISGQVAKRGGAAVTQSCEEFIRKNKKLPTGEIFLGPGGDLHFKHVIHTVGPIYALHSPYDNKVLLVKTVENCLKAAEDAGLASLAMPFISSGVFGYPLEDVTKIMIKTITAALPQCQNLQEVRLVQFDVESWTDTIYPFVCAINGSSASSSNDMIGVVAHFSDPTSFAKFKADHVPN